MTQSLIDSKFLAQFSIYNIKEGLKFHKLEAVLLIIVLIGVTWFLGLISKKNYFISSLFSFLFIAILIIPMFIKRGIIYNFYDYYQVQFQEDSTLKQSLNNIGIQYVDSIIAHPGRNILILSLESYESSYIDSFKELTPNLNKLKQASDEWKYINLEPCYLMGWTFGSLYGLITGLPIVSYSADIENGNDWGLGIENKTKLQNFINVLNAAGYSFSFFIVDAHFAGTTGLLNSCGNLQIFSKFNLKSGENTKDLDLFTEMKKQLLTHKDTNRPFAFMLSSVATHNPRGVYDERFEKILPKEEDPMRFMAHATDYMVGDLIDFLKKNNLYDKTDIYIFPDHPKMGVDRSVFNHALPKLFLLTKSNSTLSKYKDSIRQIDEIRYILNASSVQNNAQFLCDVLSDSISIYDFYDQNLLSLNSIFKNAFISNNSINSSIKIQRSNGNFELKSDYIVMSKQPIEQSKNKKLVYKFNSIGNLIETSTIPIDSTINIGNDYYLELTYNFIGLIKTELKSKNLNSIKFGFHTIEYSSNDLFKLFKVKEQTNPDLKKALQKNNLN